MTARDDYPKLAQSAANPAVWILTTECGRALDEIDRLRRWKAEALEVLAGWERVWEQAAVPDGLGRSKSELVREEVIRLQIAEAAATALTKLRRVSWPPPRKDEHESVLCERYPHMRPGPTLASGGDGRRGGFVEFLEAERWARS